MATFYISRKLNSDAVWTYECHLLSYEILRKNSLTELGPGIKSSCVILHKKPNGNSEKSCRKVASTVISLQWNVDEYWIYMYMHI